MKAIAGFCTIVSYFVAAHLAAADDPTPLDDAAKTIATAKTALDAAVTAEGTSATGLLAAQSAVAAAQSALTQVIDQAKANAAATPPKREDPTTLDAVSKTIATAKSAIDNVVSNEGAAATGLLAAQSGVAVAQATINKANDQAKTDATAAAKAKKKAKPVAPSEDVKQAVIASYQNLLNSLIGFSRSKNPQVRKSAITQLGQLVLIDTKQDDYPGLDVIQSSAVSTLLQLCLDPSEDIAFAAADGLYTARSSAAGVMAKLLTPTEAETPKAVILIFTIPASGKNDATSLGIVDTVVTARLIRTLAEGAIDSKNALLVDAGNLPNLFEMLVRCSQCESTLIKKIAKSGATTLDGAVLKADDIGKLTPDLIDPKRSCDFRVALLNLLATQKAIPDKPNDLANAYFKISNTDGLKNSDVEKALIGALTALQAALPGHPEAPAADPAADPAAPTTDPKSTTTSPSPGTATKKPGTSGGKAPLGTLPPETK